MRTALLICTAALACAPAFAEDLVAYNGADSVRLGEAPCASKPVLERLQPQMQEQYKTALASVDGKSFAACWRVVGNAAHLVYEDGDQGVIPLAELKPQLSA